MADTGNIIIDEVLVKHALYGVSTLVDVGYTQGGVTVNIDEELKAVRCDQVKGDILETMIARNGMITFSMLEQTLANWKIGMNLPDSALTGNTLTVGLDARPEIVLQLVTVNPAGYARTITFPKCKVRAKFNMGMTTENEQLAEVEVRAFPDATATNQICQVVDATS